MAMPASCAARAMICDSPVAGSPGSARYTPSAPSSLPPAALMGLDQAARSCASSATTRCAAHTGSLATSAESTGRSRCTAAAHEPLLPAMLTRSSAMRSVSGRRGATMCANAWRSAASTLTLASVPGSADSTKRVMEASTSGSGALRVTCSNTLRSAALTRSLRLRSEMSAMEPRTRRRLPLGSRTRRTSHMISCPEAS